MELPSHIQTALGVASPISEDDLVIAAEAWPQMQTTFGLSGVEFKDVVVKAQAQGGGIIVSKPPHICVNSFKYLEVYNDGILESWSLSTPRNLIGTTPTAIGEALVKAWLRDATVVNNGITSGLLLHGTLTGAKHANFTSLLSREWAQVCFFLEGASNPPSWVNKCRIDIEQNTKLITSRTGSKYERLLLEAISEFKGKWRFLSLYRILEHGYLSQIFQTLEAEFFISPKASLDEATNTFKTEWKQFINLSETASLQNEFQIFYDKFEVLRIGGNQLANAIDRSIRQEQNFNGTSSQKGVLFCYKIRCSIVHAGFSSPIFDGYPDGNNLLEAILPILETIALKYIGITIS